MSTVEQEVEKRTRRVQLEMPERSYERLQNLVVKTEAASYTEVMKNALRIYEALINKKETGHEIFMQDAEGNMVRYELFI